MKTRTRRFILRLIVALLTFLIGVFAVVIIRSFNPSESHHAMPQASRCSGARAWQAPPPPVPAPNVQAVPAPRVILPVYRPELESSAAPQSHRPGADPVLPSFEDEGEVKSQKKDSPRALQ
ncbi:MAG TPA: hypothetical protein VGX92_11860 [Pyrinomonadaceae bacterium]|jgi:hypothetical protein|nr:hypothetical protein [Pyrinomonadaceae bacterium]